MAYNTGLWGENREGVGAFWFGDISFSISGTIDKTLDFVGQNFTFSAIPSSENLGSNWVVKYSYIPGTGFETTATSATINYPYKATHDWQITGRVYNSYGDVIITSAFTGPTSLSANPLPEIYYYGTPAPLSSVYFEDNSGYLYFPGSIVSADWDFGDGSVSSTTDLTTTLEHSYTAVGTYTVNLSAYDISGHVGVDTKQVVIFEGSTCKAKENYITICGPEMLSRFGSCRYINLVEYLPQYLRGGEAEQFLVLFEDFLNEMYPGLCGWQLSAIDLPVTENYVMDQAGTNSATAEISSTYVISGDTQVTEATNAEEIQIHFPTNAAYHTSAQRISILEKVNRLTELHDPGLIDLEYIQFFASNLGYNINISRDEIGNSGTTDQFGLTEFQNECSAAEMNRYLRFVVENLPTWYKIKTTRNAIKVMLYSFGLVGDIIEYFTDSYKSTKNGGKWRINRENDFADIPKDWFPTPHFAIWIDIEKSSNISFDISRKNKVVRAIESIRPVNTVFDKLYGYIKREIHLTCAGYIRYTRYKYIASNGYSNRKPITGWPS